VAFFVALLGFWWHHSASVFRCGFGSVAKFGLFVQRRRCLQRLIWPNSSLKWDAPTGGGFEVRFLSQLGASLNFIERRAL